MKETIDAYIIYQIFCYYDILPQLLPICEKKNYKTLKTLKV